MEGRENKQFVKRAKYAAPYLSFWGESGHEAVSFKAQLVCAPTRVSENINYD
jgi:hypothetical protein